jgi:hypothetical protein
MGRMIVEIKSRIILPVIAGYLLFCFGNVHSQILEEQVLDSADSAKFQQEIDIFTTIKDGITLSVAECELVESCPVNVNRSEVEQLITVIDSRVNALSLRYTESADRGLESVLVSYADTRDGYKALLDKMNTMPQFAQQSDVASDLETDDFFTGAGSRAGAMPNELMQLFQDADEELLDDDMENTPEAESSSSAQ